MASAFLIADDSPIKIGILKRYLEMAGWEGEIVTAATTEGAMRLIDYEQMHIGYAFVDYYIPSHNGPAVIAYLKRKNPAARIALVSSSDSKKNFDEAKAAGAEACVCTSWQGDRVERTMMELIESWK